MEYRIVDKQSAHDIANLTVCLTNEIVERTGIPYFEMDAAHTETLCRQFIQQGHYTVLAAIDQGRIVGFGALCESHSLYAEGSFGILQEFYVLPNYRSQFVGRTLLEHLVEFAKSKKWVRLELCTPPIPAFDQTVAFYKDNGFEITGGYKMRYLVT